MGDVVNLGKARKARARAQASTDAAANRAAFGRTRAQKAADAQEKERRDALLDGAKRED
jgi:hypothetical protein